MPQRNYFLFMLCLLMLAGCATAANKKNLPSGTSAETPQEVSTALQSVAGAVTGQKVDKKRLEDLAQEMQQDKATESAVQSVTEALGGAKRVIKYCPIDGKRFSGKVEVCPEHNVLLKNVEE